MLQIDGLISSLTTDVDKIFQKDNICQISYIIVKTFALDQTSSWSGKG
jgi:hypothetical protein